MKVDVEEVVKEQLIEYFRLKEEKYTPRQYELFREIVDYYSEYKLRDIIITRLNKICQVA